MGLSPSRFIIKKKVHKERFRPISLPPSGHALDWAEFLKGAKMGAELFLKVCGTHQNAAAQSCVFLLSILGKKAIKWDFFRFGLGPVQRDEKKI